VVNDFHAVSVHRDSGSRENLTNAEFPYGIGGTSEFGISLAHRALYIYKTYRLKGRSFEAKGSFANDPGFRD
jgi:hypothetical protein